MNKPHINYTYLIIAYPLDSIVSTPMLYYSISQHANNSVHFTWSKYEAMKFSEWDIAIAVRNQLLQLLENYLILVHKVIIEK